MYQVNQWKRIIIIKGDLMSNTKVKEMTKVAVNELEDKLGEDITVLDITGISVMADYFIIATAKNVRHARSLADDVDQKMSKMGFELKKREGERESGWILMDYNDLIIHIFDREQRLFYDLERIWSDGKKIVSIDEI